MWIRSQDKKVIFDMTAECSIGIEKDGTIRGGKKDTILGKISRHYGYEAQSRQCIEEMAELTQAINKFWRKQLNCGKKPLNDVPFGTKEEINIEEELVDVYIMILQMKYLHKISDSDFDNEIRRKLDRQLRRMEEESCKE